MVESSTKCPTILLKADTSADVNLMNAKTFVSIFKHRTVLWPSSLRMEAYGKNMAVENIEKVTCILRWEGKVYRQLFYVTKATICLTCIQGMVVTCSVLIKPCYSVESVRNFSKFQWKSRSSTHQPATTLEKAKLHVSLSVHCENEGTKMVKWTDSKKTQHQDGWNTRSSIDKSESPWCLPWHFHWNWEVSWCTLQVPASNQMQNLKGMYLTRFQFIYRKLSTRKSGIWNN